MSRRHVVTTGCVLAITALTLAAPSVAAKPSAAGSQAAPVVWKPPPGMIAAFQRDLKLTGEQAQARLLNEARLAPIEAQLRGRLGAHFGGSWFTGTIAQTLVVATTDPADLPQIIAAGAQGEVVKRSYAELDTAMNSIDLRLPDRLSGGAVRFVDVKNNRIVVLTAEPLETEDLIQASGVDSSIVRAVQSTERPRLLNDARGLRGDARGLRGDARGLRGDARGLLNDARGLRGDARGLLNDARGLRGDARGLLDDVRGGDAYYVNTTSRCSIGFSVTHGSQKGFASAGHCGKKGDATAGFNRAAQGVFQASSFPGDDAAWVEVNNNWILRPVVNNGSGGTVSIAGSREAIEGASVCRSGSTTDWQCGVVRQRDASVTYAQGTVFGVTRTSVCAEPGDSGGSFISIDQAQGVTSGGSGDCSSGGVTYFQPINEILTTYGLTLVTDSNAIPPDTGTCAGLPKNVTGTLNNEESLYQPDGRYYQSTVAGVHSGCLDANEGVDFDLFLEVRSGSTWSTVATSDGPYPDERINYTGAPGYYRYRVVSASGSGPYKLGYKTP